MASAVAEIFVEVEARELHSPPSTDAAALEAAGGKLFWNIIGQIAVIGIVFSLDSVITAVVFSVGVMLVAAKPIGEFVDRHPSIKVLALAFLMMVGIGAHRRSLRLACTQGLHLCRDGVFAGRRGAQHPRPRQAAAAGTAHSKRKRKQCTNASNSEPHDAGRVRDDSVHVND